MQKIGLFYASSTGNTENAAQEIASKMAGIPVELHNVDSCAADAMAAYDSLILGVSTWGDGDLQDDWDDYIENLDAIDFTHKTVALFGLGDQEEYSDCYLDALGTLYDKVTERGATVVGGWPTEGYEFDDSTAIRNEEFVGLALDADNQDDLTSERIERWVELIRPYFLKEAA
jgi:flavodoxin I